MNNTFCLFIFLCLVFARELIWEFSAETIAILGVQVRRGPGSGRLQAAEHVRVLQIVMAVLAQKQTIRLVDGIFVLCLYPLSLILVAVLEASGLN
jgi:hypothetical protein